MYVKLTGFAPDADETEPGIITDCENMIPTLIGMKAMPSGTSANLPALAAPVRSCVVATKTDNSRRTFAATQTQIYEASAGAWADVSKVGGYAGGTESRTRFAQYGNVTIATNKTDPMQASTTGAFADLSVSAPKASIVETVREFVLAFDTNDGTYGDQADRWWCCKQGDHTSWTPSVADQSATARLLASPGPITAAKRLGDDIVVYKDKSMYLGRYSGPPYVFDFQLLSSDIGALSQEAVVNTGTFHLILGYDNFYIFDGARPRVIENKITDWFFSNLSQSYRHLVASLHDRHNSRVYWFYPTSSATRDKFICYNYRADKWGKGSLTVQAAMEYISGGYTIDSLASTWSTIDALPNIPFDSPFWNAGSPSPAYFDSSNLLRTLSGVASTSTLTTGVAGSDETFSLVRSIRPRFATSPRTATLTHSFVSNLGEAMTSGTPININNGKFSVLKRAKWHKGLFTFDGDVEITGLTVEAVENGRE